MTYMCSALAECNESALIDSLADTPNQRSVEHSINPPETAGSREFALDHDESAAAVARANTRDLLKTWGLSGDLVDEVVLVVSELVTNAVEHALPPIMLHLEPRPAPGEVHIEVSDGGPSEAPGPWAAHVEPEEHGRGNQIVSYLAAAYGTCFSEGRSTRWVAMGSA